MAMIRKIGKGIGSLAGGVVGGGVKLAGKAVKSEWVEEVGDGIKQASTTAFENAGQFIDGAVKGTYGAITKDEQTKQEGFSDLKDSSGRTLKGIGSTVVYTAKNAGITFEGLKTGDKEKALQGVKNIGKVAAVTMLAVGVIDMADGADIAEAEEITIRNDHLGGDSHPETGVPFIEKTVESPNGEITGAFPAFENEYEVQLPKNLYLQSDSVHFAYANGELYEAIQTNPALAHEIGLDPYDVQQLAQGNNPEGYTWHHNEEAGALQLVDEDVHQNTGHTGGRELWGGGVR